MVADKIDVQLYSARHFLLPMEKATVHYYYNRQARSIPVYIYSYSPIVFFTWRLTDRLPINRDAALIIFVMQPTKRVHAVNQIDMYQSHSY